LSRSIIFLDAVASRIKFTDEIKVYRATCEKRIERGLPLWWRNKRYKL